MLLKFQFWLMKFPNRKVGSEWCYVEFRKTDDGLGTQNTEEMNGPQLRPMAH